MTIYKLEEYNAFMKDKINLYIDESGIGNISYLTYRYFIMSSIVMSESEEKKAHSFFSCWKSKHTVDPDKSFHSTDFFENNVYTRGKHKGHLIVYRKKRLNKIANFKAAIDELVNLITYLKFNGNVYYVDLRKVQTDLKLNKKDSKIIKDIINEDYNHETLYPIYTVSRFLYKYHETYLKNKKCGFVCYESQKENDMKIVQSFHEHVAKMNESGKYIYGRDVIGLNFYNKASVCSGLEIADLIAYSTNQALRIKNAKSEIKNFDKERLNILMSTFGRLKKHFKIKIRNVTRYSINDFQEVKRKEDIKKKNIALKQKKLAKG